MRCAECDCEDFRVDPDHPTLCRCGHLPEHHTRPPREEDEEEE